MPPRRVRPTWAAWCAAVWAGGFAAGSWALALGWWDWPATRVAPAIGARIAARDPAMVTALWATGALKLALAGVVLVTWSSAWVRRPGAWLLRVVGAGLLLWGGGEAGLGGLVATAVIEPPEGWGDGSVGWWYAGLWGPLWVLGGLLVGRTGGDVRRLVRPAAEPRRCAPDEGRRASDGDETRA